MATVTSPAWLPRMSSNLDRLPMAALFSATALLFGIGLAWSKSNINPATFSEKGEERVISSAQNKDETHPLVREGEELTDLNGTFRLAGERVSFHSVDGKVTLTGLENKSLERVARTISETSEPIEWIVSGTVTQFRGANYLLLTRAVIKNQSQNANPF